MSTLSRLTLTVAMGLVFAAFTAPTALHADSLDDFGCWGIAKHMFQTEKPVGAPYTRTEHWCELPNGQRQGETKVTYVDYTGTVGSSITKGRYHNGMPIGKWVTTDVTGAILMECIYANGGTLVQGDPGC